jgi:protein O-GlcNAc transferase
MAAGYSHEALSCYGRSVAGEAPGHPPNRLWRVGALLALVGAILVGRHLIRLDPALKPGSLHGLVGLLRYELRDSAGAAASYRADIRDRCESLRVWLDQDHVDLACGTVEEARARAMRRLAEAPESPEPLLTLGEIALDEDRPEEAVHWFEQARSRAPNDVDAHLLAALGHARTGRFSSAIQSMRRVLREGTARRALSLTGVLDETGRLYALAAEGGSACLLAHLHRYLRIFDPSQAGRAVAQAREAIERDDHAAAAYVTLGVIHQKQAEDAEALGAFLRAIELDPHDAEAYRWAAVVYADRGDLENQHRMTRAAYESAQDDPAYVVLYARLLENRLGDYRSALELEHRHRAPGTETPAALAHRARLHALLGEAGKALALYRRAAAMAPRDPDHRRGEAWALMLLHRDEEAAAVLRQALELDPYRNETRYRLGMVYRRLGRYDEALEQLEPAFLRGPGLSDYHPDLCAIYFLTAHFDRARWCADRFVAWSPDGQFLRSFDLTAALDGQEAR